MYNLISKVYIWSEHKRSSCMTASCKHLQRCSKANTKRKGTMESLCLTPLFPSKNPNGLPFHNYWIFSLKRYITLSTTQNEMEAPNPLICFQWTTNSMSDKLFVIIIFFDDFLNYYYSFILCLLSKCPSVLSCNILYKFILPKTVKLAINHLMIDTNYVIMLLS